MIRDTKSDGTVCRVIIDLSVVGSNPIVPDVADADSLSYAGIFLCEPIGEVTQAHPQ